MNEWRDDCSHPPHGQKCWSQDTLQRRDSTRVTNTLPLSLIHSLLFPFCVETESKLFRMALTSLCSTGRSWSSNPSSASPGTPPAQADTNLSPVIPIIPSVVSRDQHSNPDGQAGFAMCFRTAAHLWLSQCLSGLTSSPQTLLQHGAHPHNLRFSSQIIWWFFFYFISFSSMVIPLLQIQVKIALYSGGRRVKLGSMFHSPWRHVLFVGEYFWF